MHPSVARSGMFMRQLADETPGGPSCVAGPNSASPAYLAYIWTRVPVVDPTIQAAWIAAGVAGGVGVLGIAGTVVTSVVGSRNTRKATEKTVDAGTANTRATLDAARDDRLWEKKCAAYEETIAGIMHRQQKRRHDLRGYRLDDASEDQLKAVFDAYDPPGWFEAQARLAAYASDLVLEASHDANAAHREVRVCYQRYSMMADDNKLASASGQIGLAHGGEETLAARRAVDPAVDDADAKDARLIMLIRDELRSKPEAARPPSAQPG